MKTYSVATLAKLAGVSVRTLHLYDTLDLLKPGYRSEAGYRFYGDPELLRLQQILFYKEMGMSLDAIRNILDDPDFDVERALKGHKEMLLQKKEQIELMLLTIEKTIFNLKEKNMLQPEELYEGLSKEEAGKYRNEAIEKYGAHAVDRAEYSLKHRTRAELEQLKTEQKEIASRLEELSALPADSEAVQALIKLHYENIRKFWGTHGDADPQTETYRGLADLYISDERFLQTDGRPRPELALFLKAAINHFADNTLSRS